MSMIQCPNCKSMVDNSGAFCPNCGTPIAAAPEAPVQPVQAQPSQPSMLQRPFPKSAVHTAAASPASSAVCLA